MGNRREGNKLIPTLSPFNGHRAATAAAAAAVKAISKGKREGRCQTTLKTAPGGKNGGTKASGDYILGISTRSLRMRVQYFVRFPGVKMKI